MCVILQDAKEMGEDEKQWQECDKGFTKWRRSKCRTHFTAYLRKLTMGPGGVIYLDGKHTFYYRLQKRAEIPAETINVIYLGTSRLQGFLYRVFITRICKAR
jgi:hypothetical protein